MISTISLSKTYHYLLAFCALIIGVYSKLILIGLLPLFILILWGFKNGHFFFNLQKIHIFWIILYCIYAAYSLFYWKPILSNQQFEYKLAWIIFPLLFSFEPKFQIKKQYVYYGFAAGILATSIIGIIKASLIVLQNGISISNITSGNICINHPTYFASGAILLLMIILIEWKDGHLKKLPTYLIIATVIFLLIMILLSYSMASFLFMGLLSVIIWIWIFKLKKQSSWKRALFFFSFPILMIFAIAQIKNVRDEFSNSLIALNKYIKNPTAFIQSQKNEQNGDEIRLIMWTAAFQECLEHPMGVGPTQIGHHLSDRLFKFHQNELAKTSELGEVQYNPHNQFLQIALEVGILSLIFFLFLIFQIIHFGKKNHSYILIGLVLLLSFQCLFESMLQRQTGIVTFTFFISYLVLFSTNQKRFSALNQVK